MCGIAGIFIAGNNNQGSLNTELIVNRMLDSLAHRGPDDRGVWVGEQSRLVLGHRRLSIIDLSPLGKQPMSSASGRYQIVFNGEIYNFKKIREELEKYGIIFRGHSDTEVLLAAIEHWGIDSAIKKTEGMFAIAIWDTRNKTITLVRDRLGEKPLYYGWVENNFVFASELKAFTKFSGWVGEINREALSLFMRFGYIPEPYSIYTGVYKLTPGCSITFRATDISDKNFSPVPLNEINNLKRPCQYWSVKKTAEENIRSGKNLSETEAIEQLDLVLSEAVKDQMVADVPLGAFLSGGIDSSTIVALMQKQSIKPVNTFTMGFDVEEYDEAVFARDIAKHLKTNHTEMYVSGYDALNVIPDLPTIYDEPFSDSSQIPTYLVSELARKHVTVSLSGDGGDELFAGYNRYLWSEKVWNRIKGVPSPLKELISKLMLIPSTHSLDKTYNLLKAVLPERLQQNHPGYKIHKLAKILNNSSVDEMYLNLMSYWNNPLDIVKGCSEPESVITSTNYLDKNQDKMNDMLYWDLTSYLPGDNLVKLDRASMAVSLETRVPMLNHRVVELAWKLPLSMKVRNGKGKWILRQVLYKYVPEELMDRPKRGFSVPIGEWLRGSLRDWAEDLLDYKKLDEEGYLNPEPIHKIWKEHIAGNRNCQMQLWPVLMFQAWHRHYK